MDLVGNLLLSYRIADNQLSAGATWDADLLRFDLNDLKINNFDVNLIGFDLDQLTALLA